MNQIDNEKKKNIGMHSQIMRVEWWRMIDKWWLMNDERMMKNEWLMINKGWMTNAEWWIHCMITMIMHGSILRPYRK